jgi:CheY-like chemotaxis protein
MSKKILWIDDDYFAIEGLMYPLKKQKIQVDFAISALEGYRKAQKWQEYDLIVVDLIIPVSEKEETTPSFVKNWENEEDFPEVGVGIVTWLKKELRVTCPVLILSVVANPIKLYSLEELELAGSISKRGLLPTALKEKLMSFLGDQEELREA